MAKPIAVVPKPAEQHQGAREELQRRLDNAPLAHAEALLSLLDLLQAAHDNHVLEIARGALSASNDIVERLARGARSESTTRALRNGIVLSRVLGAIDPEVLHGLLRALPTALAAVHQELQRKEPPSLFQIARRLASRDARRAQAVLASLLASVGTLPPASKP